jgi:hypothetical protein
MGIKSFKFLLVFLSVLFLAVGLVSAADDVDKGLYYKKTTKISQKDIMNGAQVIYKYAQKNKKLPNYVTIKGNKYSMEEFLYAASKTTAYRYSKKNNDVTVKLNIKSPSKASGNSINGKFTKKIYTKYAKNIYKYMDKYNQAPNYFSSSKGKVKYQTAVYSYAKLLYWSKLHKNTLPSSLTIKISKTNKINKYTPKYKRTPSSTSPANSTGGEFENNAIWVHSGDMNNVNLQLLKDNGIGNVILHENAFKEYGTTAVKNWMAKALTYKIKTHIWFSCFYNTTSKSWINPIDLETKTYNQSYFNSIINRAKTYAAISGVAGIHLDYVRYSGSTTNNNAAYQHNYTNGTITGVGAITEFVRQISTECKKINSKIIMSAALMPETVANAKYYGQDTQQLGKYLDVLMPMVYEYNYNQDNTWITKTTKWFVDNAGSAKVWVGLQTYNGDATVQKLSVATLTADCKSAIAGLAAGIALFRWGLLNLFNLLTL